MSIISISSNSILKDSGTATKVDIWKFNFHISGIGVVFITFFGIFGLFGGGVAYAGEVVFETQLSWYYNWLGADFGSGSITRITESAIRYMPLADEEVCTAKLGLYKHGTPTDSVVMTVREGGNGYPPTGAVLASVTVPADQVSGPPILPNIPAYTAFKFSPCLHLAGGTNYFFVLSRTQLPDHNFPDLTNLYTLQISNLTFYPNTAFWAYVPVNYYWNELINYEPAMRLEGPDTKEPVIIVPGILGSRLNRVSDGEEVWPNAGQMFTSKFDDFLNDLKLDQGGSEILDINSLGIVESVLGMNQYGNLIQIFKDNGYELGEDLFVMPYDWRLDIEASSNELDSIISQALTNSPTGKVNIIAHSMGGLLVKDYLVRNGESTVNKVVFAGTPHLGAPKAFNLLNWGDDFDIRFLLFGLNKNKAKEIGQNMPAVYQLLPSRAYVNKAGSYVQDNNSVDLDYDQTNNFLTSSSLLADHRNAGLLARADEFHQSHDGWAPSLANVYNLLGCREYDTIGSFAVDEDGSVDINSINGDGTVPFTSAEHIPGNDYFVSYFKTNINHVGLISDDRTIGLIYKIITDSVSVLPTGISQIQSDCDGTVEIAKRLRFSTHSPVNLHVYDFLGNHTGLTPEGNIETNIPDSNFIQVGDSSFVFVPDGEYTVQIEAYATGSFDFKIKELINGEVLDSVIYDDVPIDDQNLEADFEWTDVNNFSPLDIDRNGDGISDAGYSTDGRWVPYNATIQSTLLDLERVYSLGWTSGEVKNSLKVLLAASLPTTESVQSKGKKANGVLGTAFLNQLETEYNEGNINEKAFNIIKGDILWLINF